MARPERFVTSGDRKRQPRPQPPMGDRRTKRARTRSAQKRIAITSGHRD